MSTFDWIKINLISERPVKKIGDLIPNCFNNYFLINWNYGIVDNFPFDIYPADTDNIENINKRINIDRKFGLFPKNTFTDSDLENLYRKITLEEIALKFNLPHTVDIISKIKNTPGLAPLPSYTKRNIKKLIQHIHSDKLYLYIADNDLRSWMDDWTYKEENIIYSIEEYLEYLERTAFDSISFLFNDKNSWCLARMEDFEYFIFCADNQTAEKLKLIPKLEIFKVDRDYKFR